MTHDYSSDLRGGAVGVYTSGNLGRSSAVSSGGVLLTPAEQDAQAMITLLMKIEERLAAVEALLERASLEASR